MWWSDNYEYAEIEELIGKVLVDIKVLNRDVIYFVTDDGTKYKMFHWQSCCESVEIEEIIGDLDDLIGYPICMAEKVSQNTTSDWGSSTWTFYKLGTNKGCVTLRWLGESNGYYSESVDFIKILSENNDYWEELEC